MSRQGRAIDPEKIERARLLRGWSQTDLARVAGLPSGTVHRACGGKAVSVGTILALSIAFFQNPPKPELRLLIDGEEVG